MQEIVKLDLTKVRYRPKNAFRAFFYDLIAYDHEEMRIDFIEKCKAAR